MGIEDYSGHKETDLITVNIHMPNSLALDLD